MKSVNSWQYKPWQWHDFHRKYGNTLDNIIQGDIQYIIYGFPPETYSEPSMWHVCVFRWLSVRGSDTGSNSQNPQQSIFHTKFNEYMAWWRHQMEAFSVLLALCVGNSPVTAQRPVMRSFDVFFDLCLNKRLSKQLWGWWFEKPPCSLWHHCNGKLCIRLMKPLWVCTFVIVWYGTT